MDKITIYSLVDPITSEVRYIGRTNCIQRRHKGHIDRPANHKMKLWMDDLKNKSLIPLIEVVDIVDKADCSYWERYWINQFRQWGFDLLNISGMKLNRANIVPMVSKYSPIQVRKVIYDEFSERCRSNGYKISGVIKRLIEDWLDNKIKLEDKIT